MPYEPRADRLDRGELLLWQRRALRSWIESDWLAEHDPVAWSECQNADPTIVRVAVGMDEPGAIVVGSYESDRRRTPDLPWSISDGLPFEDQTVDEVTLDGPWLSQRDETTVRRLPAHLARVLRVGGCVYVRGSAPRIGAAIVAAGFTEDDMTDDGRRHFTLTQGKTSLADAAPLTMDERNMGERVIREPRQPYRR